MTERSYQDAVQVLRQRIGRQWQGDADEGRDAMLRILRDELGFDAAQARDALDLMISTGQLRYHPPSSAPGTLDQAHGPLPVAGNTTSAGVGTGGLIGAPIVPSSQTSPGYWEIGRDDGGETPGRKGQVTPSGL